MNEIASKTQLLRDSAQNLILHLLHQHPLLKLEDAPAEDGPLVKQIRSFLHKMSGALDNIPPALKSIQNSGDIENLMKLLLDFQTYILESDDVRDSDLANFVLISKIRLAYMETGSYADFGTEPSFLKGDHLEDDLVTVADTYKLIHQAVAFVDFQSV